MPDDLEQLDETGVTEDAGAEYAPVFAAEPVPEEQPEPPAVVAVEDTPVEPAPLQKFKVNARHSHSPSRWETVEARDEDEARRVFEAKFGGDVQAIVPGEAKVAAPGRSKINER